MRQKIAVYVQTLVPKSLPQITGSLPEHMASWGGVRIGEGGDSIRCVSPGKRRANERKAFYVRVRTMHFSSANFVLIAYSTRLSSATKEQYSMAALRGSSSLFSLLLSFGENAAVNDYFLRLLRPAVWQETKMLQRTLSAIVKSPSRPLSSTYSQFRTLLVGCTREDDGVS